MMFKIRERHQGLAFCFLITIKESSQNLLVFSLIFLIWDYKEDNLAVCARGVKRAPSAR